MALLTLVLSNVRSAHNVGSIFRSADAFGIEQIMLCGITPYPEVRNDHRLPHVRLKATQMIAKTALGGEQTIPFRHIPRIESAIKELKTHGHKVVALEQHQKSVSLTQIEKSDKIALIVGNEVKGISERILAICDVIAEIPMRGKKESLNVSVATGVALYELTSN